MSAQSAPAKVQQVSAIGVTPPPDIYVECQAFSGSLATLFLMVRDHKVNLLGVPLAPVCEAFAEYLIETSGEDTERAASAIAVLSYLLERKAFALLPVEEASSEDPPELSEPMEPSVQEFAQVILALNDLAEERGGLFFRQSRPPVQDLVDGQGGAYELPIEIGDVTTFDLARAFERLVARDIPDKPAAFRKPARSLSEMMVVVSRALQLEFKSLDEIVVGDFTRTEAVWWFLALLELIRIGQARVRSHKGEVQFAGAAAA